VRVLKAEAKAIVTFKKIFKRLVNFNSASDDRFVQILSYRLRVEPRNLDSEKTALKKFIKVYKVLPKDSLSWAIIRALAYSGVVK